MNRIGYAERSYKYNKEKQLKNKSQQFLSTKFQLYLEKIKDKADIYRQRPSLFGPVSLFIFHLKVKVHEDELIKKLKNKNLPFIVKTKPNTIFGFDKHSTRKIELRVKK